MAEDIGARAFLREQDYLVYLAPTVGVAFISRSTQPQIQPASRLTQVKEGLSYIWNNKVVFGAISLDLFAVPLGEPRPFSRPLPGISSTRGLRDSAS